MYGVFLGLSAEMGGRCSCYIGVIAELNGCCSCASGPGQAADLLCSGQCCDLFEHQDTHFSAWGLLPVHTLIRHGASGFAGPLEHMAAAASSFNFQPDLSATSAAKATEYMKESAAASVAPFLLDGQTDLLVAPAAKACHFLEHQSVKETLQAAAVAAATLVESPFVAVVLHMSEWCWFVAGFWIGCILLWNGCQVHLEKDMPTFFGKGKKQGCTSKESQESCPFSDLQTLTQADSGEGSGFVDGADSEGECVLFKGKGRHDTDGSLSLGLGEASGRVDVPVSVDALPSAEKFCRSQQSVALVNPWLLRRENYFCEGCGWEHSGTPGPRAHCCGRVAGLHG